jgi:hypothetical protein
VVVSIFGRVNEVWREWWYEKCPCKRSNDGKGRKGRADGRKQIFIYSSGGLDGTIVLEALLCNRGGTIGKGGVGSTIAF